MLNHIFLGALAALAVGCATTASAEFDPDADERIGAEVKTACFSSTGAASGGHIEIGGRDAFITGRLNKKYLLVFSRGCGNLDGFGDVPVFRNYGDNCRRRGELVQTFNSDMGVSGGCLIQHIYEWDRKKADEEETNETG